MRPRPAKPVRLRRCSTSLQIPPPPVFFAVLFSNLHHDLRYLFWGRKRQFLGRHCQRPDERCELARLELVYLGTLRLAKTDKGNPRLVGFTESSLAQRVRAVLQSIVVRVPSPFSHIKLNPLALDAASAAKAKSALLERLLWYPAKW
jgi:hypothetical protein